MPLPPGWHPDEEDSLRLSAILNAYGPDYAAQMNLISKGTARLLKRPQFHQIELL